MRDRLIILPGERTGVVLILGPRLPSSFGFDAAEAKPVNATAVEPKYIDLAVVRAQFVELAMILLAHLHGACLINIREEETRESPVERRIIKTDAQPSFADGLHVLGNEVAVSR